MITELAIYEKARHEVVTDQQGIEDSLFALDSKTEALIGEADGVPVGYAVFLPAIPPGWGAMASTLKTCTSRRTAGEKG